MSQWIIMCEVLC